MLAKSPEAILWEGVGYAPASWELEKALTFVPEARRANVIRELDHLKNISERYDVIDEDITVGFTTGFLRKKIIPEVRNGVLQLSRALYPFKKEGDTWENALQETIQNTTSLIKGLTHDERWAFNIIMGEARSISAGEMSKYQGTPLDMVCAPGWAMLTNARRPHSYILDLFHNLPVSMEFRGIREGGRVVEVLMMDFPIRDHANDFAVACVANSLKDNVRYPLFVHDIEEDCSKAQPYLIQPKRVVI